MCFFFQNWKKFGNSEFDAPGPNVATTTVSDDVFMTFISSKEVGSSNRAIVVFRLLLIIYCSVTWGTSFTTMSKYYDLPDQQNIFSFLMQDLNAQDQDEDPMNKLKGQKIVSCRICKGDHWTTRCPYKDTLGPMQKELAEQLGLSTTDKEKPAGSYTFSTSVQ